MEEMKLNNITEKQSKSVFLGKISLIAGLSNILLLFLSVSSQSYGRIIGGIMFFSFCASLSIGIVAGIAAFISKRAWVGLAINLLMLIFLGAGLWVYFSLCCAPLPQI